MTFSFRFFAAVCASLLLIAVPTADQAPQQTPAQPQAQAGRPPQFQSGTQVVQVDVRVFDKSGHFVADLKPEDFEIKEDGVAQPIDALTLVGGEPRAPNANLGNSNPERTFEPPNPRTPEPRAPSTWLFVFDTTHLTAGALQRTQRAVEEFLKSKFREGDVAGVVFEGRMANNRLTTNREELVKAVQDMKLPGDATTYQLTMTREWPRIQDESEAWRIADQNDRNALQQAVIRACSDQPDRCKQGTSDAEAEVQNKTRQIMTVSDKATALTLRVVEALCNGLTRMAGPKTIAFFSEGFLTLNAAAALQHATGLANRAGAHFYTVDARGLNKGAASSIIDEEQAFDSGGPLTRFDLQEDGTNALAVDTGGMAIRNENNFGRALDIIQQDSATYYVLGYTPSNQKFDGKYRSISVDVKRPGLKVRARRGYLASDPATLLKPVAITTASKPAAAPGTLATSSIARAASTGGAPSRESPAPSATATAPSTPAPAATTPPPASPPSAAAVSAAENSATAASAASLRARIESKGLVQELQQPAERLAPGKGNDPAGKGWAAYQKGDVVTAARYLGQAAESPEAHPWVHYALGLAHLALQQYPDAVRAWEDVRTEQPDFEPVYFNLADGYMLQRDETAALKVLEDAQRRWPADPEIWNAMGVLQIRRSALDSAIESFTHATEIAPKDALGFFNLGRAYQMRATKFQRYDSTRERWVGGESDTQKAQAAYQTYIRIGGPFVQQAKEALQVLAWK